MMNIVKEKMLSYPHIHTNTYIHTCVIPTYTYKHIHAYMHTHTYIHADNP